MMKSISLFLVGITSLIGGSQAQTTPGCITDLSSIEQLEVLRDPSVRRVYILCPRTTFNMGLLEGDNNQVVPGSGQRFIQAKPNLEIWCGSNGSRANGCVLDGGSLTIDATDLLGGGEDPAANIVFRGLTFSDTRGYYLWGNIAGNILFQDCEFKDTTKAAAPFLLDFFDSSSPTSSLEVTFSESEFANNTYFGPGSYTALITSTSPQNELVIGQTKFIGNDYVFNNTNSEMSSSLVDTSGPLSIEDSCFIDNVVGVAPVVVYAATWQGTENYGENSAGGACPFIADFQNQAQFEFFNPSCFNFQTFQECTADGTRAPSVAPSYTPTSVPSSSPTTSAPTTTPSTMPSSVPTAVPTTGAPTQTAMPSPPPSPPTVPPTPSAGNTVSAMMSIAAVALSLLWAL